MKRDDKGGSAAARGAWIASGLTFFLVGVIFTLTMPDSFAIGITFLGLGVVFFSLSATQRAPGDGPGVGAESMSGSVDADADADGAAGAPDPPPLGDAHPPTR
ncbi:MAG: hypothetical protein Q7J04_07395 [Microcella sp.]|nr:hypothetical protein [Microcella sp.]